MLYKGSSEIQKVYLGGTPLSAIYHGINKIYPKDQPVPPGPGPEPAYPHIIPYGDEDFILSVGGNQINPTPTLSTVSNINPYNIAYETDILDNDHTAVDATKVMHERINPERVDYITTTRSTEHPGTLWIGRWFNDGKKFIPAFAICQGQEGTSHASEVRLIEYNTDIELDMVPVQLTETRSSFSPIRPGGTAQTPDAIVGASNEWSASGDVWARMKMHLYNDDDNIGFRIELFSDWEAEQSPIKTIGYRSHSVPYANLSQFSVVWGLKGGVANRRRWYGFYNASNIQTWDPVVGWLA